MKQKMRRWSASFLALLLCVTLFASTAFAAGGALGGPFFICGISGENFCSLTDAQVQKYRQMFLRPQIFLHTEREIGRAHV